MKSNLRILCSLQKFFALFCAITSCSNLENQETQQLQEIESIKLNKSELVIYFGDEVKLVADITPENTDSNLVWSSSDESIAMVHSNGVLTALYSGIDELQEDKPFTGKEVNIYCTSTDGKISATCKVTVFPKISIVTSRETNKPFTQFFKNDEYFAAWKVYLSNEEEYHFHLDGNSMYWIGAPSDLAVNKTAMLHKGHFHSHFKVPVSADYDIFIKEDNIVELYFHPSVYFAEEVLYLQIGETKEAKLFDPKNQIHNPAWVCSDESIAIVKDGQITAVSSGEATLTLNADYVSITCKIVVLPAEMDGTIHQPANCHIAPKSGKYHFRTTIGNSNNIIDGIASAEVLWEDLGTYTQTNISDLITEVSYQNNFVTYIISENHTHGNAVIAVKDASGKILWSWHIWLTEEPKEQTYYKYIYDEDNSSWDNPVYYFTNEVTGIVMDRNLGAVSAEQGGYLTSPEQNFESFGLYYQWGRKDPFPIYKIRSSIVWPSPVQSDRNIGNIEYSIAHPTTFMLGNAGNNDWYYFPKKGDVDNTRWSAVKTIYDPCPFGWRVPAYKIWEHIGDSYDEQRGGLLYDVGPSIKAWYPAAGRYNSNTGEHEETWSIGYYWSLDARSFDFNTYTGFPTNGGGRAAGKSIRCIRDI